MFEPQRDAKIRESVCEIGRAIQWVHIPPVLRCKPLTSSFFTEDAVVRKQRSKPLTDQLLAGAVSLGDDVDVTLELCRDALFWRRLYRASA